MPYQALLETRWSTDHRSCLQPQIVSGKGVLGQLSLETGLSTNFIEIALVTLIGYNLFSVSNVHHSLSSRARSTCLID